MWLPYLIFAFVIIPIEQFLTLRLKLPVVDVRSENEFLGGHIREAVNIPILNNEERVAVGTDYKQKGQAEAIKTGFRLVGPRFLEIVRCAEQVAAGEELLVHCWRGGMRSSNFCQIVGMAKIKTYQLQGGYKSYRELALQSYRTPMKLHVIGGYTGSGKSEVLRALRDQGEQIIDLETLASHKGSVFGGLMMPPQPTTEQFQNDLFEELIKLDKTRRIWVEDESIAIGKIFLPHDFWMQMSSAPVYHLEVDESVRIQRLVNEYGKADKQEFLAAMEHITKKLGGQNFNEARNRLFEDDMSATIEILLRYYDKAYKTGLTNKQERIRCRISWDGSDPLECAENFISCAVNLRQNPVG
ncbi:MAG TPA: tRNA 2-selenouridine(34) synthase MnmH [Chryseosolibacter sp.]|nr:tRNA 2-selenouridine(34) synthase MnmH [Chryseosolibacter sp.]